MKLTEKSNDSLNKIRPKIIRKAIDLDKQELLYLNEVYMEIQKEVTGKSKPLNMGCSSCINNAVNIVHNFVMFHEERHEITEKNKPNIEIVNVQETSKIDELKKTCDELGIKYHHKAGENKLIQLIEEYHGKE